MYMYVTCMQASATLSTYIIMYITDIAIITYSTCTLSILSFYITNITDTNVHTCIS